ncbi:MAG: hypothetical protein M3Y57_19885 [Acidobacteriota bacterium]|nr:hypothetical protein [Acidobacteriota bacterium]
MGLSALEERICEGCGASRAGFAGFDVVFDYLKQDLVANQLCRLISAGVSACLLRAMPRGLDFEARMAARR